jgi:hypothetical protein
MVGFGSFLRVLGVLAGVAVAGGSVMFFNAPGTLPSQNQIGMVGGLVLGVVVAVLGFALGTLVVAIGQILKAVLDSAVNTSPLLPNERKAEILGL